MLPALNPSILTNLARELDSYPIALEFLERFESTLPSRITAIDASRSEEDGERLRIALLSLNTSATMIGAAQLRDMTARVLTVDHPRELPQLCAGTFVGQLTREAQRFTSACLALRGRSA